MKSIVIFCCFLIILCFPAFKASQDPDRIKVNESIARSFIDAWDSHDAGKLASLFAENCLYEEVASGRRFTTPGQISQYFTKTISGVPDTEFETLNLFANDSLAVVEWIWKGTNSVGWNDMGIPATNRHFELRGLSFMVIKNNRIKRNSDYWDWNSFMKGIGANTF